MAKKKTTDPAEAWSRAAYAWQRAWLAHDDDEDKGKLADRAHRLTLQAEALDPERAKKALEDAIARHRNPGPLFDQD